MTWLSKGNQVEWGLQQTCGLVGFPPSGTQSFIYKVGVLGLSTSQVLRAEASRQNTRSIGVPLLFPSPGERRASNNPYSALKLATIP